MRNKKKNIDAVVVLNKINRKHLCETHKYYKTIVFKRLFIDGTVKLKEMRYYHSEKQAKRNCSSLNEMGFRSLHWVISSRTIVKQLSVLGGIL